MNSFSADFVERKEPKNIEVRDYILPYHLQSIVGVISRECHSAVSIEHICHIMVYCKDASDLTTELSLEIEHQFHLRYHDLYLPLSRFEDTI